MQFKNIIGQRPVHGHLADMVKHNRLSHALLFLAREGTGGLAAALAFSQYIVCEKVNGKHLASLGPSLFGDTNEEGDNAAPAHFETDSCGQCTACIKAQQFIHPDIHYSFPVITQSGGKTYERPKSSDFIVEWREFLKDQVYGNAYDWLQAIQAENRQGNITSDECTDIIRKLNLKSFESETKVLIMWMPEYLGNMGNKLLKLIEEPPLNTLFIFVAENEALVLPTILSRCQLVRFPLLSRQEIQDALITEAHLPAAQAAQLAGISEGSYREALHLIDHGDEDWDTLLRDWLNAIIKTGPIAQVKWIDRINQQGREKQKQFLRYFNHLLQQSIRLEVLGERDSASFAPGEVDFARRFNKMAGIGQQKIIIEELDKAAWYIERNANGKLLFHALTIRMYHILKNNATISSW